MSEGLKTAIWLQVLSIGTYVVVFVALAFGAKRLFSKVKLPPAFAGLLGPALRAVPKPADPHWIRGRARVLWGPTTSRSGGLAELAEDVTYAIDETGHVELSGIVWHVTTDRGERLVLPLSQTAVVWIGRPVAVPTPEPWGDADQPFPNVGAGLSIDQKIAKLRWPPQVFFCPHCQATYTKEIEAYICYVRDQPREPTGEEREQEEQYVHESGKVLTRPIKVPLYKPQFGVDGDCKDCGYPAGLHAKRQLAVGACSLTFAWPSEKDRPREHVEHWKQTTLVGRTP